MAALIHTLRRMIKPSRVIVLDPASEILPPPVAEPGLRARVLWTLSNLLMLIGVVVLLYAAGLHINAEYNRYAARGDTDLPAPVIVESVSSDPSGADSYEPAPFVAPLLNTNTGGRLSSLQGTTSGSVAGSTITRVIIPSIGVDSKVVEVGWDVEEQNGQQIAVWQVAKYAVGQHRGSANPGEGDNIVLAGHVGGFGKVFKDLYYVQPGDQIVLYSEGQQYLYIVQENILVTEEGVSDEQRLANAQLIAPTGTEMVTLVTCWPATGPDKYSQRVVVRAVPYNVALDDQQSRLSSWVVR